MKEIEKYVMVISGVALVSIIYLYWSLIDFGFFGVGSQPEDISEAQKLRNERSAQAQFKTNIRLILNFASHFVSCAWLYYVAKSESLSKSAWSLFGLSFGVVGVACYYAASVHYQLKGLRRKTNANKT